jgi:ADP-ribosyl-[dinitrogen reductase] hydrolase
MTNTQTNTSQTNTSQNKQAQHARAKGAVTGALIGDAAGGVLEFIHRQPETEEVALALTMPGGGVLNLAPGQITDDGEMTLALLQALVKANGDYQADTVAKAYSDWQRSKPFDIGIATQYALKVSKEQLQDIEGLAKIITRQAASHNAASKANGCVMRATPLAIAACKLDKDQTIKMVYQDCGLTHPNKACLDATAAYVLAIRHLILTPGDSEGALKTADEFLSTADAEVKQWFDDAMTHQLPDAHLYIGFVRYAFIYTFYHLKQQSPFEQALTDTLLRGGDTDTNACIVGGMIGALWGEDALPEQMKNQVMNCNTDLGNPRPNAFRALNKESVIDVLVGKCL